MSKVEGIGGIWNGEEEPTSRSIMLFLIVGLTKRKRPVKIYESQIETNRNELKELNSKFSFTTLFYYQISNCQFYCSAKRNLSAQI